MFYTRQNAQIYSEMLRLFTADQTIRALHGLQRGALLRERGVKFVVAAALLLGAFDQRAQPVGSLEQPVLLCRQDAAVHAGYH